MFTIFKHAVALSTFTRLCEGVQNEPSWKRPLGMQIILS